MRTFRTNFAVKPIRLLCRADAADYCCRSSRSFAAECSVSPVVMANGDQLYDIVDLDAWIDGLKGKCTHDTAALALESLR